MCSSPEVVVTTQRRVELVSSMPTLDSHSPQDNRKFVPYAPSWRGSSPEHTTVWLPIVPETAICVPPKVPGNCRCSLTPKTSTVGTVEGGGLVRRPWPCCVWDRSGARTHKGLPSWVPSTLSVHGRLDCHLDMDTRNRCFARASTTWWESVVSSGGWRAR